MSQYSVKAMLAEAVPTNFQNWPCSQVWPLVQYQTIALQESSQEAFSERNGAAEVVVLLFDYLESFDFSPNRHFTKTA